MSNIHGFIAFFAYCLENSTSCHLKRQMGRDKWYLMIWNGKMFETNSIKSLQLLKPNLDQVVNGSKSHDSEVLLLEFSIQYKNRRKSPR